MSSEHQDHHRETPHDQPAGNGELPHLLALLDEARTYTHDVLAAVVPGQVVHTGSGWTVHDVVAHILAWEHEVVHALRAFQRGAPAYRIAGFVSFEATNSHLRDQRRALPFDDLLRELTSAREQFKNALAAIPSDRFDDVFDFPWPASGTVGMLVLIMAAHERGHAVEIARAAERGKTSPWRPEHDES